MQPGVLLRRVAAILIVTGAAAALPASASVIYSNFGTGGAFDGGNGWITSTSAAIAAPFQVQAGDDVQFTSALLAQTSAGGDTSNVFLMADSAGQPGIVLDTLVGQSPITGTSSIVTYNCTLCPTLSAGSTYWLIATYANGQTIWNFNNTGSTGGSANVNGLSNSGPWNSFPSVPSPAFQVEGSPLPSAAVPEPASIQLLGLAIVSLAIASRRKHTRRNP